MVNARITSLPPNRRTPKYNILGFIVAYLGSLTVFLASSSLVIAYPEPTLGALPQIGIIYIVTGIFLSRYIGKRVIYWTQMNNIQNVIESKYRTILYWPVEIPRLTWCVFVAKHL